MLGLPPGWPRVCAALCLLLEIPCAVSVCCSQSLLLLLCCNWSCCCCAGNDKATVLCAASLSFAALLSVRVSDAPASSADLCLPWLAALLEPLASSMAAANMRRRSVMAHTMAGRPQLRSAFTSSTRAAANCQPSAPSASKSQVPIHRHWPVRASVLYRQLALQILALLAAR